MLQVQGSRKDPVCRGFMLVSLCLMPLRAAADAIILLLCKHFTSDKYTIPEFRLPSLLLHRPINLQLHHTPSSPVLSTNLLFVPSLDIQTALGQLMPIHSPCIHLRLACHQSLTYACRSLRSTVLLFASFLDFLCLFYRRIFAFPNVLAW